MSFVDSLAGPIGTPQLNPDEAAAEATRAKEQADAYAKQQAEYEARAQAQADLAAAARNAEEQRAINDAMATSYQKYGQDKTFINPVTGRAEFFPKDYHLPTSAEVAQRVLPAPAASGTVADIAKWTPPSTPHVEDDLLGPVDKALADVGAGRGTEQPTAPSPSGPLRWSMGGKWYERAPGSSVDVPVKQVASPGGTTFEAISGAKPMSPETMADIREGVRSLGAFGDKLAPVSDRRTAGGVSTSSQPAFLPPSMIENAGTRLTMAQIANAKRELEPADLTVPEGSVSPRESLALEMAKRSGATKGQAMGIASELANRAAHQPNPNPNSVEQQDQRYMRLTQAQAAHDKAVQQINNDTRLTAPQKADQIAKVTAALSLAKQNYRLGKGDMLADILAETQAPTK